MPKDQLAKELVKLLLSEDLKSLLGRLKVSKGRVEVVCRLEHRVSRS